MADDKVSRRNFLRKTFVLGGAGIGALVGVRTVDDAVKPQAQQAQQPAAPVPGLPPVQVNNGEQHIPADLKEQQAKRRAAQKEKELSPEGKHIAMCAAGGAGVGGIISLALTTNNKKVVEENATPNDEERVKWERQRQIREEMDRRYNPGHQRGDD